MRIKPRHIRQVKKTAPWALGGAAGLFLFGNLATSFYIEQSLARPSRKQNKTSDLSDFVPETKYTSTPVEFRSVDGFRISALLLEPEVRNDHAVLVCHGVAHDKRSGIRFVQFLLREGYTLLLIDFRNHGESDGQVTTYGYYEKHDLLSGIRYLRYPVGIKGRIGVLGASMGASIAILAAAESKEIDAMVLDSPFASLKKVAFERAMQITKLPRFLLFLPMQMAFLWIHLFDRFDVPAVEPSAKIKDVHCPVFLIHGTEDLKIPVQHSKEIFANAVGEKDLWIVDKVGHLGAYLADPSQYHQRVLEFFRKNLLEARDL